MMKIHENPKARLSYAGCGCFWGGCGLGRDCEAWIENWTSEMFQEQSQQSYRFKMFQGGSQAEFGNNFPKDLVFSVRYYSMLVHVIFQKHVRIWETFRDLFCLFGYDFPKWTAARWCPIKLMEFATGKTWVFGSYLSLMW